MKQLLMDTSSATMSVALVEDDKLVMEMSVAGKKNHSLTLMPAIETLFNETAWSVRDLDNIVVAQGPGSYTGIRIAMTTAKTLAWTLKIPLRTVSSLALLALTAHDGVIVPLINARRHHVYAGIYRVHQGKVETLLADQYIELDALLEEVATYEHPIFTGETAAFADELAKKGYSYIADGVQTQPKASMMTLLPYEEITGDAIHHVVPTYLKKVEAEENWEKTHHATQDEKDHYVQTTK